MWVWPPISTPAALLNPRRFAEPVVVHVPGHHDLLLPGLAGDRAGGRIREVPDAHVDGVTRQLFPARHAVLQGSDGHQAVHAHLAVVLPAHQVVDHGDLMSER